MNATTTTIQIEDWYAPAFSVRINAPKRGLRPCARRGVSDSRIFHVTHRGPCGARPAGGLRRARQFVLLGHA